MHISKYSLGLYQYGCGLYHHMHHIMILCITEWVSQYCASYLRSKDVFCTIPQSSASEYVTICINQHAHHKVSFTICHNLHHHASITPWREREECPTTEELTSSTVMYLSRCGNNNRRGDHDPINITLDIAYHRCVFKYCYTYYIMFMMYNILNTLWRDV